jgi:isopentenyldiphosphate isomerase
MFVRKQHVCITQRADETEIWNDLWYNSNKF